LQESRIKTARGSLIEEGAARQMTDGSYVFDFDCQVRAELLGGPQRKEDGQALWGTDASMARNCGGT